MNQSRLEYSEHRNGAHGQLSLWAHSALCFGGTEGGLIGSAPTCPSISIMSASLKRSAARRSTAGPDASAGRRSVPPSESLAGQEGSAGREGDQGRGAAS